MVVRTLAVTLASLIVAAPLHAAVLCAKKKGSLAMRDACKPKETQVDPAALGLVGPQGPQGPQGPAGTPAAVAFAHIINGFLVAADSQNVTASSVPPAGPSGMGVTCVTVNLPVVHNALFTMDVNESGGPSGKDIFVAVRPADVAAFVGAGQCPQGTNVVAYTIVGGNPQTAEFYALFY